ncbi:MAG: hypothetical protein HY843_06755 [Bdellovibrio sp.]|nr:hypothetical protein [Bdellovibrio sp.]
MGRVIAFSEFDSYIKTIQISDYVLGTILDTNILVSLTYEIKTDYEEVTDFVDKLIDHGICLYTTVNTKAEFLDFHRRLMMTEHLRDLLDSTTHCKISSSAKAQIQVQSGQLKRQEQQGGDPVFSDRQIKKIKSAFSAGMHSGHRGWLEICRGILAGRLDEFETRLIDNGIQYISQHEPKQKELFHKKIDWPDAKRISEMTCLSLADAMIINACQCSKFKFIVSADFDIGYSALSAKEIKDVLMPDSVAKKYRDYHFEIKKEEG